MKLVSKSIFVRTPGPGTLMYGNSFYVHRGGVEKMRTRSVETRSDLMDSIDRAFSSDNGRTWSDWEKVDCVFETPQGVRRFFVMPGFVDPTNDRLLTVMIDGVLPGDHPLEGMTQYHLRYQVSLDGGHTAALDEQIIQTGAEFTSEHPVAGVWIGRNAVMFGDVGSRPLRTRHDTILVPIQITPLGPDGKYYNPVGGLTFTDCAVLIGRWKDGARIEWDMSETVKLGPDRSTRGAIEPTIAEMPDGRILMVMRGSNDTQPELPGYRWHSTSQDGGYHWSDPQPWTYDDGSAFFSPSSMSQLLLHSSGRYYWLGNICAENPRGNSPRYPLVIAQVDPGSLLLVRDSLLVIDNRQPDDHESLTLSNFMAHEDRETHEIVLHMSRFIPADWIGDAYIYRVEP